MSKLDNKRATGLVFYLLSLSFDFVLSKARRCGFLEVKNGLMTKRTLRKNLSICLFYLTDQLSRHSKSCEGNDRNGCGHQKVDSHRVIVPVGLKECVQHHICFGVILISQPQCEPPLFNPSALILSLMCHFSALMKMGNKLMEYYLCRIYTIFNHLKNVLFHLVCSILFLTNLLSVLCEEDWVAFLF